VEGCVYCVCFSLYGGLYRQGFYQYVLRAVRYSYVLVQAVQYQPQGRTEGSGGQVARSLPRQVARLVITSSY
jgi:hypothetical protein